jgi:hypothetical protein
MTHLTRALGASAILAALAAPAIAQANVHVVCDGQVPVVTLTGWTTPASLADVTVTADGEVLRTGPLSFPGQTLTLPYPLAAARGVTATARLTATSHVFTSGAPVTCAPAAPAPAPEPTPEATPRPQPRVEPTPTKRPTVRRPPVKRTRPLTCADLKARGAGRGWYTRLGIPYYRCHVPQGQPFGPRRPFRGVAG